jgi:hypothetical protein
MRLTEEEYRLLLSRQGSETPEKPVEALNLPSGPSGPSKLENAADTLFSLLGAPEWVREHPGIPGRKFRFDFAWPEQMVAVEINGGIFKAQSGHRSISGLERDYNKANLAQLHGWAYFQLSPRMIEPATVEAIIDFIKAR